MAQVRIDFDTGWGWRARQEGEADITAHALRAMLPDYAIQYPHRAFLDGVLVGEVAGGGGDAVLEAPPALSETGIPRGQCPCEGENAEAEKAPKQPLTGNKVMILDAETAAEIEGLRNDDSVIAACKITAYLADIEYEKKPDEGLLELLASARDRADKLPAMTAEERRWKIEAQRAEIDAAALIFTEGRVRIVDLDFRLSMLFDRSLNILQLLADALEEAEHGRVSAMVMPEKVTV